MSPSRVDLHTHSSFSADGELSPRDLVHFCRRHGVGTLALTDHNTVRGIEGARDAAREAGLTFVPGIELDCAHEGVQLHLLGYGIDPGWPAFAHLEAAMLEQERAASDERVARVEALGIRVDRDAVDSLARDGVVTGEIIAEVALGDPANASNALLLPYRPGGARRNPYVSFYWDFCAQGRPAYVPVQTITLGEAVRTVGDAGGVSVLAHPGVNTREDAALLASVAALGLWGLEVYSSYHTAEQVAFYREQARRLSLAPTCGSDFHGKTKPDILPGSVECGASVSAEALLAACVTARRA